MRYSKEAGVLREWIERNGCVRCMKLHPSASCNVSFFELCSDELLHSPGVEYVHLSISDVLSMTARVDGYHVLCIAADKTEMPLNL